MTIGVLMAMFHYPNNVLENGTHVEWVWLEVGVDFIQPVLFALGMTWLPINMSWWGNTTLGCYAFHFYFKDQMGAVFMKIAPALSWEPTGLLLFFLGLAFCLVFTTFLGPVGHQFLILPQTLPPKIKKMQQNFARRQEEQRVLQRQAPAEARA